MGRLLVAFAALSLSGCASSVIAERNAPDLSYQGPLRGTSLSQAQIKILQQGLAASVKDKAPRFGGNYRAAVSANGETIVCGYVNGKRFAGMFAKPKDGPTVFLPIGIAIDPEEEVAVKLYCRDDGIYLQR